MATPVSSREGDGDSGQLALNEQLMAQRGPLERLQAGLEGRYTIEQAIGRGGMATVYRAIDEKHHRKVALKLLDPRISSLVGPDRFLQEIEFAAKLHNTHIVPLYDSGDVDGLLYYTMPYFEGESLRARIEREKQLPIDDALAITNSIATALSYAHSQGVIHRDIKPDNIMLEGNEAVVADFGIGRAVDAAGGDKITDSGIIVGTAPYMSPEQGQAHGKVDGRSDLYSLGCVLFEMLAGEPPFTGATDQVIIARHQFEPPPKLSVARSTVTPSIEYAVEQVLAKVPADRPETAERFVKMLDEPAPATAEVQARSRVRKRTRAISTALVVSLLGLGLWQITSGGEPVLDDNRVIVFPLVETGVAGLTEGIGETAALWIGSALEETAPLRFEDGWKSLDNAQQADFDGVTNDQRNAIARAASARYRLDGSIVATGNSANVILWLYDVKADSLIQRKTVEGASADESIMQSALLGVKQVLPVLLQPGHDVERIPLEALDLGAATLWMQGKREHRASRFEAALSFYDRAIERDSTLAMAALDAAQVTTWTRRSEADRYINIALAHESALPEPMVFFAHGLYHYLSGGSDSAVIWFRQALETDEEWAEAHMALGEVFYHLMPSGNYSLDSVAQAEFRAASADSNFSPPLFHLAEAAIRRGDLQEATVLIERYRAFGASELTLVQLTFMLECLREPSDFDWSQAVRIAPLVALNAAKALSAGARQSSCAEGGFLALLQDTSVAHLHYGAFQGYQGILLASGRLQDFVALLDSVIQGRPPAMTLYLSAAIVDSALIPKALEAEAYIRNLFGQEYQNSPSNSLSWTMGVWHAYRGDKDLVDILLDDLSARTRDRRTRLLAENLAGNRALLQGDSAQAISIISAQSSTAPVDSLVYWPEESLSTSWLLLSNLLLESGMFHEAIQVAARYDHQAPITYPSFAAASLRIRYRAAQELGDRGLISRYRDRLLGLGRSDLVTEPLTEVGVLRSNP